MRLRDAVAEDFRRVGIAAIVTGLIGGFLEDKVAAVAAVMAVVLGIAGYWLYSGDELMTPYIVMAVIAAGLGIMAWVALRWDKQNRDRHRHR